MSIFEELGIPGPAYLRERLANCSDPAEEIEQFQNNNGILLPSLRSALPLLDLHGVRRLDFHRSLIEMLRERLKERIDCLVAEESTSRIKAFVEKNFALVKEPSLRPILLYALSKMTTDVPHKFLQELQEDRVIYNECPLELKRLMWQHNPSLFGDEVTPLLSEYIKKKEFILYSVDVQNSFLNLTPKIRRQEAVIKKLADCIGSNIKLYDRILQFLRTLFLRTRNVHYCTLRAELLMILHDQEVIEITGLDPCHKFTWCMDACVRDKDVDIKRAKELQGFLNSLRKGREYILGDVAMVICDPYTVSVLVGSAFRQMQALMKSVDQIPRRNEYLNILIRLLTLGMGAWDITNSQDLKEPHLETNLLNQFCPALISLMVDDQIRPVEVSINKMYAALQESTSKSSSVYDDPIPSSFLQGIKESKIAGLLAGAYLNYLARSKNQIALERVLIAMLETDPDLMYSDMFLHQFIFSLVFMAEEFSSEKFCELIFSKYLVHDKAKPDNVLRHLMRLLILIGKKINKTRLDELVVVCESVATNYTSAVYELFQEMKAVLNLNS